MSNYRSTVVPGIQTTMVYSYTPNPSKGNKVSLYVTVGLIVTGSEHSGKTINFSGDGSFVFNIDFAIPTITGTQSRHYFIAKRQIDDLSPMNQNFTQRLVSTVDGTSNTINASETVYNSQSTLAEPQRLTVRATNTSSTNLIIQWVNSAVYSSLELVWFVESEGGYNPDTLIYEGQMSLSGNATNALVTIPTDTKYRRFYLYAKTAVQSVYSDTIDVIYRRPMLAQTNVQSRIMRTGILVTWDDPNPENAGKVRKYRINITGNNYVSSVITESDQRAYYFNNLPKGNTYQFSVAVIDPVTDIIYAYSLPSAPLYLSFVRFNEEEPYDYRLGTSLVRALYVGDRPIWTRT